MNNLKKNFRLTFLVFLFFSVSNFVPTFSFAQTQQNTYTVTRVIDGDTFDATDGNISFRVRIAAMDAPEKDQSWGSQAKNYLSQLIAGKKITIEAVSQQKDTYNRVLGLVYIHNKDIAYEMISLGLATYYRPFCKEYPQSKNYFNYNPEKYMAAEKQAKKNKSGFWKNPNFTLPCEYRLKNK